MAVNHWKELRTAKAQAHYNNFQASQARSQAAQTNGNMPSTSTAVENSDEDDVVVAEQLTLDQVIEV